MDVISVSPLDIVVNAFGDVDKICVHSRPVQTPIAAAAAVRVLEAVVKGQSEDLGRIWIGFCPVSDLIFSI